MKQRILLSAVPALWRNGLATMLQYRGEIFLWAIWGVIYPAVAIAMWSAALSGSDSGTIKGFDQHQFAAYFLLTMLVGHFGTAWDAYEMGYMVRSGRMSTSLLRPILPMWSSVAGNLAYKVVTLSLLVPIWVVFAFFTKPEFNTTGAHIVLGIPALIFGSALNYLWGYNIACLAFWTTRVDAISEFWFGGSLVFGGRLAPLALLPVAMQWVAAFLPFKWILWFPSEVLTGRIRLGDAALGLLGQIAWLAAGVLVFRLVWHAGLKRYSAVGA